MDNIKGLLLSIVLEGAAVIYLLWEISMAIAIPVSLIYLLLRFIF